MAPYAGCPTPRGMYLSPQAIRGEQGGRHLVLLFEACIRERGPGGRFNELVLEYAGQYFLTCDLGTGTRLSGTEDQEVR